ncbi:TetR/AcrR family transcriptional regulator [Thalassococcus lentus]|uniref:TetR/AcrR family transcriptional regulator n=1 Tax=Thalassococcus lentus TaxID=1210524 RepID=A0ABT4XX53_9RHOB|nr:TetR/AcrR family transcriptional regulator [Thalassococcus lentus]MDA7426536.1 TetR/AcrR family transcriptional regulator [Thalassococcus lentus]
MNSPAKPRGRPKTLDRDRVLEIALMNYWSNGPAEVSVNDICAAAKVSKPGLYREFGSDDGLKTAALMTYKTMAIDPFLALFRVGEPYADTVETIVSFLTKDKDALGLPAGCLFVTMRAHRDRLGPETGDLVDQLRDYFQQGIAVWVDAQKEAGLFRPEVPTAIAVHHIDTLHSGAMRMQKEQIPTQEIEDFLRFGFATLTTL